MRKPSNKRVKQTKPNDQIEKPYNWKLIVQIIIAIIAFMALVVAIRSCFISEEAIKIANDSFEASQKQFIKEYRPIIEISLNRQDNELYWKVTKTDNLRLRFHIEFIIMNRGTATAMNIKLPKIGKYINNEVPSNSFRVQNRSTLSLPPGSARVQPYEFFMGPYSSLEKFEKAFKAFSTGSGENVITIGNELSYRNEMDQTKVYKTPIEFKITGQKYDIIKSDYIPPE